MTILNIVTVLVLAGIGGYAALVLLAWRRYGRPARPTLVSADLLLDRFMPEYDIVERHHITIAAPPEVVMATAAEIDVMRSPIARAIFATRAFVMRAKPDVTARPTGLLAQMRSIGWGDLAATRDREVVLGAITQPWLPSPRFQPLPPDAFRTFSEPGVVKIAWTLRADSRHDGGCDFWTETRALPTDDGARRRFRGYWARVSPGVWLIRYLMLAPLKVEAERRARILKYAASTAESSQRFFNNRRSHRRMSVRLFARVVLLSTALAAPASVVFAQAPVPRTIGIFVTDPVGDKMEYSRKIINAKPGDVLHIELTSTAKVPKIVMAHNFVLLKLGTDAKKFSEAAAAAKDTDYIPKAMRGQIIAMTEMVGPGERAKVTVNVPKTPGTYTFLCSFAGHYAAGMVGQLIVK